MKKVFRRGFVVAFVIALVSPRHADSKSCTCAEFLELVSATEDGVDIRDRFDFSKAWLNGGYVGERTDPTELCLNDGCLSLVKR